MKQRKVFLLGAGAAMDWKGPSTCCLTELIRKSGFKNSRGESVTEVIFQQLCIRRDQCCKSVNFETIINTVEDFFQFWATPDKEQVNGLAYLINKNDPKWRDLINYAPGEGNAIHIEGARQSLLGHELNTDSELEPNAKYFGLLFIELMDRIVSEISEYSYYTPTNNNTLDCEKNKEINDLACRYLTREAENNFLRFYSLNYDKVVQFIFEKSQLTFFDGFDEKEQTIEGFLGRANLQKILINRDSNCIYHLHGNASWFIRPVEDKLFPLYEILLSNTEQLSINDTVVRISMEKGRQIMVSNIITGYNKTQRSSLAPFRQMAASFDMDCLTADELVIIGYSFGDEHINDIIRQVYARDSETKITVVSPDAACYKEFFLGSSLDVRFCATCFKSFLKQELGQSTR